MTRTPPRRVVVWGAAKVNIGWRVGDRRPDGFHDVCGSLQSISIADRLEISVGTEGEMPVRVLVPGHPELEDSSNLVCAAAAALHRHRQTPPTTIVLHKSIPVTAGLGGGSADAAAALVGLNMVWRAGRTARQLLDIGAQISSDVPGMLLGGLVHVDGRGERVRRIGSATDGWFVLGVGDEAITAADAYAAFDRLAGEPRSKLLQHNDLEAAACSLAPDLERRIEAMRDAAGVAFVSGSGPTVVGAVEDEAHARGVAAAVRPVFRDVLLAQPVDWGVRLSIGAEEET